VSGCAPLQKPGQKCIEQIPQSVIECPKEKRMKGQVKRDNGTKRPHRFHIELNSNQIVPGRAQSCQVVPGRVAPPAGRLATPQYFANSVRWRSPPINSETTTGPALPTFRACASSFGARGARMHQPAPKKITKRTHFENSKTPVNIGLFPKFPCTRRKNEPISCRVVASAKTDHPASPPRRLRSYPLF